MKSVKLIEIELAKRVQTDTIWIETQSDMFFFEKN